jgi:putative transposase
VAHWSQRTEIPIDRFVAWLGVAVSKFYNWRTRYGQANDHNAFMPREWWLEDWEKTAIVAYDFEHPIEGYRRLAFMMLDDNVVAVSPSRTVADRRMACQEASATG